MQKINDRIGDYICILFIFVILLLFFNKIIFSNKIYIPGDYLRSDTIHQNLPFKYSLYQSLKKGNLPLWTDKIYNGFPLFAEGQVGTLSLFTIIPFLLLPFVTAYNFSIFSSYLIAAVGIYLLARQFKLKNYSSLFVALSFSMSSFFVLHLTHQNIISTASWLPYLFLFFIKMVETNKHRYILLTSLVIMNQIFSGSPQITFYGLLILFIFLMLNYNYSKNRNKAMAYYGIIIIFGILLSAIQLFPTIELIQNSTRQNGAGNLVLDSLPYHPRNFITFLFPYIFGDPGKGTYPHFGGTWGMFWENTGYFGLLGLVFSIISFRLIRKKKIIFYLWILVAISFLLSLGKYGPFFWIYYLPVFNFFRVTSRFLLFAIFALCLLSGFGLEIILEKINNSIIRKIALLTAIAILLVDLFHFGYDYNPTVDANYILKKPPIIQAVSTSFQSERVFSVVPFITYDEINNYGWRNNVKENINHLNALDPDVNILWGINNVEGYSGLYLWRNEAFKNLIYRGLKKEDNTIIISEQTIKLLGLSQAKYLISSFKLVNDNLRKIGIYGDGAIKYYLYENNLYLPKGILYDDSIFVQTNDLSTSLSNDRFNPKKQLLVEALILNNVNKGNVQAEKDNIKLVQNLGSKLVFDVSLSAPKWFLVQNTNYPGWNAYVNGINTPIYIGDGLFNVIRVPQGKSHIEFIYQPVSFYLGMVISISTLILAVMIFILRSLTVQ